MRIIIVLLLICAAFIHCFHHPAFAQKDSKTSMPDSGNNRHRFYIATTLGLASAGLGFYYGHKLGEKARKDAIEDCEKRGEPPLNCADEGDAALTSTRAIVGLGSMITGIWIGGTLDNIIFGKKKRLRFGIGSDFSAVTQGPKIFVSANLLAFNFVYGLSRKDYGGETVKSIGRSLQTDLEFHVFSELEKKRKFRPFVGMGFMYVDESDEVKGFRGDGFITGFHVFLGNRIILPDWSRLGISGKLGYSFWNYDNAVLTRNSSAIRYNYPKTYVDLGLVFFIK